MAPETLVSDCLSVCAYVYVCVFIATWVEAFSDQLAGYYTRSTALLPGLPG